MSTDSTDGMLSKKTNHLVNVKEPGTVPSFILSGTGGDISSLVDNITAAEAHKELCVFSPLQQILLAIHSVITFPGFNGYACLVQITHQLFP